MLEKQRWNRFQKTNWLKIGIGIIFSAAITVSTSAVSQPGSLDTSFDGDGKIIIDMHDVVPGIGVAASEARAVAIQPDGKIITAGYANSIGTGSSEAFIALARQNTDGSLDNSFDTDGRVAISPDPFAETVQAHALVLQPDGKIIVGGSAWRGTIEGSMLARINSDGSLDTTFGSNGFAAYTFFDIREQIHDLALQADGKIVAAVLLGGASSTEDLIVVRFNPDGSLDNSFGSSGVATISAVGGTSDEKARSVAVQSDGKILVAGSSDFNIVAARLLSDGSLDPAFGVSGIAMPSIGGSGFAEDMIIQDDGAIVLAGLSASNYLAVRLLQNGNLDSTFAAPDGYMTYDIAGDFDVANGVIQQTDGKLVLSGFSAVGGSNDFSLARLTSGGVLDTSFGNSGTVTTDFHGFSDFGLAMALQNDGKIVVAGDADDGVVNPDNFAVARYLGQDISADVSLNKEASADSVVVGTQFDYTFTISNAGPSDATNIALTDTLLAELNYVSCSAPGGSCSFDGTDFSAQFGSLDSGNSHQVTLTVQLDAGTSPGTEIENFANAVADEDDPDQKNNTDTATVVAAAAPAPLRFYLHGNDVPGTAGGFTMDMNPPSPPQPLVLNLANAPRWYSEPALDGSFVAGDFVLQFPCSLGISLATTYALHRTALDGSSPEAIGSVTAPLQICAGSQTVDIPVGAAEDFDNERLRLRISTLLGLSITLDLGEDVWLDTTEFTESGGEF